MRVAEAVALIQRVDAVRHASNDLASVRQALAGVAQLRGWLDGCEADLAAATIGRVPVPAKEIAEAAKISQRAAERMIERHVTADDVPSFGQALTEGDVSGGHVDVLAAGIRSLEPAERSGFRQHAAGLVGQAKLSTVEEFRALVQAEARRFSADHGEARLARQRRACRLRTWVSPSDGMWKLSGSFDPETGLALHGRLSAAMSRLFHQSVPDDAPDDPRSRPSRPHRWFGGRVRDRARRDHPCRPRLGPGSADELDPRVEFIEFVDRFSTAARDATIRE